jgi:hypothetical protein
VRRPSARRDGPGSVNNALDCFQKKEMRTAGGVRYAGELRPWTGCSIPCDKIKEEGSGRCASAREREGDRNRAAGDLVIVGIGGAHRQYLRASTRNSATASWCPRRRGKGDQRGGVGLFIGVAGASIKAGSKRIEEGRELLLRLGHRRRNGWRREMTGSDR